MKIEYIKICGFGSYKDETVVEFNKFNNSDLFLITGPTGSGKTTIFDAIKYSLFGESSGGNREPKNFRSKYADLDTPTYVEMKFIYRDKSYLIRRNPEYLRKSKNGKGTATENATVDFYLPDNSVVSGIERVKAKVVEILGINESQFSQIVMIAQGEFMKIILANTEDRGELFRKLFETEKYVEFQNKLKENVNALAGREREYEGKLSSEIDRVMITKNMSYDLVEAIESKKIRDEKLDELLEEDIKKTECKIANSRSSIKSIELLISDKDREINKLQARKKLQKDIVNGEENYKKKIDEKKLLVESSAGLQARKPEIKLYEKKISKFELELGDYNKIEKLLIDSKKFKIDNKKYSDNLLKLKSEISEYTSELKVKVEYLEKNPDIGALLEVAKKIVAEKKQEILSLKEVEKTAKTCKEKIVRLKKAYADYLNGKRIKNEYEEDYNFKLDSYMDEQMGFIASKLEDGKPCPVCGSLKHPSPCKGTGAVVTREIVKKAKELLGEQVKKNDKNVKANIILKENALAEYKDILKNLEIYAEINEINNLKIEQISSKNVENVFANFERIENIIKHNEIVLNDEYKVIFKDAADKNEVFILCKQYDLEKKTLNLKIDKKNQDKSDLSNTVIKLTSDLENAEKHIIELRNKLEFPTKTEANQNYESIKTKKNKLETEIVTAEENIKAVDMNIISLNTKIDTLKSQLDSSENVALEDIENMFKEKKVLNEDKNRENSSLEEFIKIKSNNSVCLKNIKKFRIRIDELEVELNFKAELSNVANGTVPGKTKLKLETYIHITFFEEILRKANNRFSIMSNNQFELVRRKETTNKRQQFGLELDVVDHMNASIRPVNTLSGGESFKAALSLALGFSDVIQAYSSGIKINTMFIDEGFGSLDEESLTNAISCLSNLNSQDVQIGIISHVEELKNRIDRKIIVNKTPEGYSKISIE